MSIDTVAPPAATTREPPPAVCPLLSRDQYFTLDRLRSLLERRDALDAERLTPALEDQPWLVRALDAAIVSYYCLAHGLGVATDAERLLQRYRQLGLGSAP